MQPQAFAPSALEKLLDLVGDDREALHELIKSFLAEAPTLIAQLNKAAATGDVDAFRRAAHTLRSSAVDFGVPQLAKICERLETQAKAGRIDSAPASLTSVSTSYKAGESELLKVLEMPE